MKFASLLMLSILLILLPSRGQANGISIDLSGIGLSKDEFRAVLSQLDIKDFRVGDLEISHFEIHPVGEQWPSIEFRFKNQMGQLASLRLKYCFETQKYFLKRLVLTKKILEASPHMIRILFSVFPQKIQASLNAPLQLARKGFTRPCLWWAKEISGRR